MNRKQCENEASKFNSRDKAYIHAELREAKGKSMMVVSGSPNKMIILLAGIVRMIATRVDASTTDVLRDISTVLERESESNKHYM